MRPRPGRVLGPAPPPSGRLLRPRGLCLEGCWPPVPPVNGRSGLWHVAWHQNDHDEARWLREAVARARFAELQGVGYFAGVLLDASGDEVCHITTPSSAATGDDCSVPAASAVDDRWQQRCRRLHCRPALRGARRGP